MSPCRACSPARCPRRASSPTTGITRGTCCPCWARRVPVEPLRARHRPVPAVGVRSAQGAAAQHQALRDASVVYGHRVLPPRLRDDLSAIDHAWGDFGDELGGGEEADAEDAESVFDEKGPFARWNALGLAEKSAPRQAAALAGAGGADRRRPWRAPHPRRLAPLPMDPQPVGHPAHGVPEAGGGPGRIPAFEWSTWSVFQLQSMQVGAADVAIGRRDRPPGRGGHLGRDDARRGVRPRHQHSCHPTSGGTPPQENVQELFRVPFFIHDRRLEPAGGGRPRPRRSTCSPPSSTSSTSRSTGTSTATRSSTAASRPSNRVSADLDPALDVVRRHARRLPARLGLDRAGGRRRPRRLVGRPLADLDVGRPERALRGRPDNEADFASLPTADGKAPQLVTGVVRGADAATRRWCWW